MNHTVPVALYCWLAHRGSFRDAVESAVCLGGDTDTVAAIVGALAGSELGPDAIPPAWIEGLAEWPATISWLRRLADALQKSLEAQQPASVPSLNPVGLLARNLLFIPVVFAHGLRRLAPPY